MTRLEYDEELAKANELSGTNTEKIESKLMIRDEIKRLKREADVNMRNAAEIREKAPAIQDDIEGADFYRQAFAKEALAIDNLRKVHTICENLDMLTQYSEQDLAQLRAGKVPSDHLAAAMTDESATDSNTTDSASDVVNETTTGADTSEVLTDSASVTAIEPAVSEKVNSTDSQEVVNMERSSENPINQVVNFSTTADGAIVTDRQSI